MALVGRSRTIRSSGKKVGTNAKINVFSQLLDHKEFVDAFADIDNKNRINKKTEKRRNSTNILQYADNTNENKSNNIELKAETVSSSSEILDESGFEDLFTNNDNNDIDENTDKNEDSLSILQCLPQTNEGRCSNIELKTEIKKKKKNNLKQNFSKSCNLKEADELISCSIKSCNENFANRTLLDIHIKEYHSSNPLLPFKCSQCNKEFKKKEWCENHYKRMHLNEKPFKCSVCDKRFFDKVDAATHEKTHTNETCCICEICGGGYTTWAALRSHRKRKHYRELKLNLPEFKCDSCGKVFNRKEHLKSHSAVHSEKKFVCNICQMIFSWSSTLRRHMNVHIKERDFVCKLCKKDFTSKVRISDHMKVHGLKYSEDNVYRKSQITQFDKDSVQDVTESKLSLNM